MTAPTEILLLIDIAVLQKPAKTAAQKLLGRTVLHLQVYVWSYVALSDVLKASFPRSANLMIEGP